MSYVEKMSEEYVKKQGPCVVVAGCEDLRVRAAVRAAYEAGYEQGRRDMEPRDAIDL